MHQKKDRGSGSSGRCEGQAGATHKSALLSSLALCSKETQVKEGARVVSRDESRGALVKGCRDSQGRW